METTSCLPVLIYHKNLRAAHRRDDEGRFFVCVC